MVLPEVMDLCLFNIFIKILKIIKNEMSIYIIQQPYNVFQEYLS